MLKEHRKLINLREIKCVWTKRETDGGVSCHWRGTPIVGICKIVDGEGGKEEEGRGKEGKKPRLGRGDWLGWGNRR